MITITYQGLNYEAKADESVLDTLLRHNIDIPYSCHAGVCNTCVMVCDGNEVPDNATRGLKDTLVDQGYFLACQYVPLESVTVRKAEQFGLFCQTMVLEKTVLSEHVCRLRLQPAADLYYRAGQYINLRMPNGEIRSYSLASLPKQDDFLELHIKRMPDGLVSNWLFDEVQQGDTLDIQGAFGDCYYLPKSPDSNILMIGTGTGLAPLIGILRDAITSGHTGQIRLYHGDRNSDGLYLDDDLRQLAATYQNIHYTPCVSSLGEHDKQDVFQGRATDRAFADNKDLKNSLVFLCGSPEMVKSARKLAYLNGADMKNIYADPFVSKELRHDKGNVNNELPISKDRRHPE